MAKFPHYADLCNIYKSFKILFIVLIMIWKQSENINYLHNTFQNFVFFWNYTDFFLKLYKIFEVKNVLIFGGKTDLGINIVLPCVLFIFRYLQGLRSYVGLNKVFQTDRPRLTRFFVGICSNKGQNSYC